jgi:hypothetical protein
MSLEGGNSHPPAPGAGVGGEEFEDQRALRGRVDIPSRRPSPDAGPRWLRVDGKWRPPEWCTDPGERAAANVLDRSLAVDTNAEEVLNELPFQAITA